MNEEYVLVGTTYRYEDDGSRWTGYKYEHNLSGIIVINWRKE